ncbi:MAG: flippase-like domain-containing protein [Dehalococcoidia bacterium]|nr:flippase-like domain-containing protein [Dehalococcoidia bacterium]MDW8119484.1 lysylphosphatidylglycerol synthase transmembrane domain-containing protein [Chloroflexota bacterium]
MSRPSAPVQERPPRIALGAKTLLPTLVSLVLAGVVLGFLVVRFDVDLGATWRLVRSSNPGWYALAFVAYYLSFLPRGLRWRLMAQGAGIGSGPGERLPSALEAGYYILQAWFLNAVGWLRVGDPYRAYAFARSSGSPFARVLGTVAGERVMDLGAMVVLLLVSAGALALLHQGGRLGMWFVAVGAGLTTIGAVVLAAMARWGMRLVARLPSALRGLYEGFHQGALQGVRWRMGAVLGLGVVGWLLEALRLGMVALALGVDLSPWMVLFVALANALLTAIPLSPGGLGFVEAGVVGLLVLTLPTESAVAVAVLDRSVSYLSVVVFGGLAFLVYQVRQGLPPRPSSGPPAPAGGAPRRPR